ncbi:MAG: ferrous iron transporter B [Bacteroidetes bacterium RIFCSPHIGHO2_02_FULL_44_7]|nr:MAG: ferrous iron transporter B [Bacteroidetes bacterium RIFCSPHIGHO2_02_FULL_44_7]
MRIALLGNPNTGKSSVFNMLTGLRQKVGNFPGVTVDKKTGHLTFGGESHEIIDFPGTYSIYPRSKDEEVVYKTLRDPTSADYPDAVLVVLDAANLERNLLLFSQVYDLQLPTIMVLNMSDIAEKRAKAHNLDVLQSHFPEATIVQTNARVRMGKNRLLEALQGLKERKGHCFHPKGLVAAMDDRSAQETETTERFEKIASLLKSAESTLDKHAKQSKLDRILIHPVFGYLIFALVLIVMFQFIYAFAAWPMDLIDGAFASLSGFVADSWPSGVFNDLISQGIIPGIGGVLIFIPQIAILFFFIAVLEETGYLARVVFIMDRLMRPLGLNGKSVVPLLSSVACAIPGVMAARTITDWKERIITIMVAPLMSCSARIPVYTVLIAVVIPNRTVAGFMNLQGLTLFALYALGTISALLIALVLKWFVQQRAKGFLLLEIPELKPPQWSNVGNVVWEKVKIFVWDAGKIIIAISIILWALASYGPSGTMETAAEKTRSICMEKGLSKEETALKVSSARLEKSYIGRMGKAIEPVIQPLGYDWKIGISLISSFAAREVFVGSMATIYAVQNDGEDHRPLIERMRSERNSKGESVYSLASGVSLMVFYVYAMQCMATLAVVKRETKSWKWPLIQIAYMGALAYLGAWIAFNLLS